MEPDPVDQTLHISHWLQNHDSDRAAEPSKQICATPKPAKLRAHKLLKACPLGQRQWPDLFFNGDDRQISRYTSEGVSWDSWIRAGLNRLDSENEKPGNAIREALYSVWTAAFEEMPLIHAAITSDSLIGDTQPLKVLLVDCPWHGEIAYRFGEHAALSAFRIDIAHAIDAEARHLRLAALGNYAQPVTEGFADLVLKDPSDYFRWRTHLDLALLLPPKEAVRWADTAKRIWADHIFPQYRLSHYGVLSNFLGCRIPHLPELLAAEGYTDSETLQTHKDCQEPQGVYRRIVAFKDRPGLAVTTRERNKLPENYMEPSKRFADEPSILTEMLRNIETAQPRRPINVIEDPISQQAVDCISKFDSDAIGILSYDLQFVADILRHLPPHLYPRTTSKQHGFAQFFSPLRGYFARYEFGALNVVLAAACRQYQLNPESRLHSMRRELSNLADFLIFAKSFLMASHPTHASHMDEWVALGKPMLCQLVEASINWHTALNVATAALDETVDSRQAEPQFRNAEWPSLLIEPALVDDIYFHGLTSRTELWSEGRAMQHCVSTYVPFCMGGIHILSARRDGQRLATLTIERKSSCQEEWALTELQGPNNEVADPDTKRAATKLVKKLNSGELRTNPELKTFPYTGRTDYRDIRQDEKGEIIQFLIKNQMTELLKRFEVTLRCGKRRTPASQAFRAATTRQNS